MRSTIHSSDRLFDRLWRPGHPFRPRYSAARRWSMLGCLVFIASIIGAYYWLTDPTRVRLMAESYLTELLGGPVHVGRASLTIFEGLTLSRVTVKVENSNRPDAVLALADAFDVEYDPALLLRGRLAATRIVATGLHVNLVEDVDSGRWNYQRLSESRQPQPMESGPSRLVLPEIVLRDAEIQYSEIRNGHYLSRGAMMLEGRLSAAPDLSSYSFQLQSRGTVGGIGPVVSGEFRLGSEQIDATLNNLRFGPDIEAMLPSEVRQWWHAHQLEGSLNIPRFHYVPPAGGKPATFFLQTDLDQVQLAVPYDELAGDEAARRLNRRKILFDLMYAAGLNLNGSASRLELITAPPPLPLREVHGTFTFDEHGITLSDVSGKLQGNALAINGRIDGYSPDSPFHLRVSSLPGQVIHLARNLTFMRSMPEVARMIYDMLQPYGSLTLSLNFDRASDGARASVGGQIHFFDAGFAFNGFPYPVSRTTGTVVFAQDSETGMEIADFQNIHGYGVAGGPNANSSITINGWVGPFDPRVGLDLHIAGENLTTEPALIAALPPEVRDAIRQACLPGSQAHGRVACEVAMPIGLGTSTTTKTDVFFDDIDGKLVAFPYPIRHSARCCGCGRIILKSSTAKWIAATLHCRSRGEPRCKTSSRPSRPCA